MRKPISTKTHAVLDYLTIGSFLFVPRLLNFSKTVTTGMTAVGLTKLAYTLLTRHELGAYKVLPMKAHLAMDVAGGAMLCALPFMAGHDADDLETAVCAGMGAFDIAAAPLTETAMRPGSASISQARLPGTESTVGDAVSGAADWASRAVGAGDR
jgi:hypothetical protein